MFYAAGTLKACGAYAEARREELRLFARLNVGELENLKSRLRGLVFQLFRFNCHYFVDHFIKCGVARALLELQLKVTLTVSPARCSLNNHHYMIDNFKGCFRAHSL